MRIRVFSLLCLSYLSLWGDVGIKNIDLYRSVNYRYGRGFSVTQNILISHSGSEEYFFITFSSGQSGDPNHRKLSNTQGGTAEYNLLSQTGQPLKDLNHQPTSDEVIHGYFPEGNHTNQYSYQFFMGGTQFAPGGIISDQIILSLYSGTLDQYQWISSVTIELAANVSKEIALSVVPSGAPFNIRQTSQTLDFGILQAGSQRGNDLIIQSNVPYQISISSQYGGFLKSSMDPGGNGVPYSLSVNGLSISNLSANQPIILGNGLYTSLEGERLQLLFTIDNFWDVPSGQVEDLIQITLSAY